MADEQRGNRQNTTDEDEKELLRTLINTQPIIVQTLERLQENLERMELDRRRGRQGRNRSMSVAGSHRSHTSVGSSLHSQRQERPCIPTMDRPFLPQFLPGERPTQVDPP